MGPLSSAMFMTKWHIHQKLEYTGLLRAEMGE